MEKKLQSSETKPGLKIGFISRLDFGGDDYRVGLWKLAYEKFAEENIDMVVLLGGLVNSKTLHSQLKEQLKKELSQIKKKDKRKERTDSGTEKFFDKSAKYLAHHLPTLPGVKTYIITSPSYDGEIGEEIARLLAEKREDILLYRHGGDRMELRQLRRWLGLYVPKKQIFLRGNYYDTPVLRTLQDEKKRSTRGIGDMNVVGCFGSSLLHPGDSSDIRKPYLSVPALCKMGETSVGTDNQVGVSILEFKNNNLKEAHLTVYSFKDQIPDEWLFVEPPVGTSKDQRGIINILRKDGPQTVSGLHDFTGLSKEAIEQALAGLLQKKATNTWPGVFLDQESKRYYLDLKWFRTRVRYHLPKKYQQDSFLAFGCFHAGCKHSDMRYMKKVVPQIILDNNVDTLVGVGDFIEGLRHDLLIKGEIVNGQDYPLNYTKQEKLSAFTIGSAIIEVFKERFTQALKTTPPKQIQSLLGELVKKSLVRFVFIAGNHCSWVQPEGFDPLGIFHSELKTFLTQRIAEYLKDEHQLAITFDMFNSIIKEKIVLLEQNQPLQTKSGLTMSLLHPSMARTKTTSIRPQEMLQKAEDEDTRAHIVFGANFHVAEGVHEWSPAFGQRVCLQLGTLKTKSGFEETKLKTVDFGVGYLKVYSDGSRIFKTETAFYTTPTEDVHAGNRQIVREFHNEWLQPE